MGKIAKYGSRPHSVRFLKAIDRELITFCIQHEINESDVIQRAVACFLRNKGCAARKKNYAEIELKY